MTIAQFGWLTGTKKYHPLVQNIEVHVVLGQELDMAQGFYRFLQLGHVTLLGFLGG